MKRWLMLFAALPLFAHAAAERIISLGGDVTEIVYARMHSSSWSLRTVPALACRRAIAAGRRLYTPAERRGSSRYARQSSQERAGPAFAGPAKGRGQSGKSG